MENRRLLNVKLGTSDELLLLRELLFEGVGPSGNVLLEGSIVVWQGGVDPGRFKLWNSGKWSRALTSCPKEYPFGQVAAAHDQLQAL